MNKYINYFLIGCVLALALLSNKQKNRLNEQKRLLIAQQQQINKLILNAEYNKLINEEKVR